jgi:F420H(2)-dependent quinone reductase
MAFNDTVEQLVRAGIGSPLPLPVSAGIVVIETKGRVSGKPRNTPLLAQRIGNTLMVSTVRTASQWVRNLEADDAPTVVLNGKSRPVKVSVKRIGDWTLVRMDLKRSSSTA